LFYHGWADPGPAPENTINYFNAANKKTGGNSDDWMRLFLLPGVGHCGGGVGPDRADYLSALEQWREHGKAPAQIIASRNRGGQVEMTRPLCPYPQIAKWTGTGSTDDAKNFVCGASPHLSYVPKKLRGRRGERDQKRPPRMSFTALSRSVNAKNGGGLCDDRV
jgi:feruloyl esterase